MRTPASQLELFQWSVGGPCIGISRSHCSRQVASTRYTLLVNHSTLRSTTKIPAAQKSTGINDTGMGVDDMCNSTRAKNAWIPDHELLE